jgi:hypothetical protein
VSTIPSPDPCFFTHRPLERPDREVTILTGDIGILVYLLPMLLGGGIRFSSPGLARTELEPISSTRSRDATILRFRVRKQTDRTVT